MSETIQACIHWRDQNTKQKSLPENRLSLAGIWSKKFE
jgi:hypothetical protein